MICLICTYTHDLRPVVLGFWLIFTPTLLGLRPSGLGVHIYMYIHLNQNSQAVKKECGPQKGQGEKRCEIQGGGQEMAVMVG